MRIVFFSTNSNAFDPGSCSISVFPTNLMRFEEFCRAHPEHEFFCVTQPPGLFMPEQPSERVIFMPLSSDAHECARTVSSLRPDIAVAMTFWTAPYDWLPVNDALVAESLRGQGIEVVCHSVATALLCFDKHRTQQLFEKLGIPSPKSLYVDHDLYFCAGSHKDVLQNVYQKSILSQLRTLRLPLVLKDTVGLSSYLLEVVHSYAQAAGYLNSKKNNSHRLVQEFLDGEHFGAEVYGRHGRYTVLPPMRSSVNQYGIASPKQSTKTGPVTEERYKIPELNSLLLALADALELDGAAQVDLVFSEEKWFVLEVNPRLSGMTYAYCAALGISVFELLYSACLAQSPLPPPRPVISEKRPPQEHPESLCGQKDVLLVNQIFDRAARQEREKGWCEVIRSIS